MLCQCDEPSGKARAAAADPSEARGIRTGEMSFRVLSATLAACAIDRTGLRGSINLGMRSAAAPGGSGSNGGELRLTATHACLPEVLSRRFRPSHGALTKANRPLRVSRGK